MLGYNDEFDCAATGYQLEDQRIFTRARRATNCSTLILLVIMGMALPESAGANDSMADEQESAESKSPSVSWPPRYQDRRFKEDWKPADWDSLDRSALKWHDRIKVLPLSSDKTTWASFGGQVRFRSALLRSPDFGSSTTSSVDAAMFRFRAFGDFHFGEKFRVFAEGIYSDSLTKRDGETLPGLSVSNSPAILNLFGEWNLGSDSSRDTGIWVGRRELQYGQQRIVSPQSWLNTRQSFEGVGGWIRAGESGFSAFLVQPVIVVPEGRNTRDEDTTFWGLVYSNREAVVPVLNEFARSLTRPARGFWEPYVFGIHRKEVTVLQGTEAEDRYSVGLLSYGPYANTPFDAEAEATFQFGRFGSSDVRAWALTLIGGLSPGDWRLNPRFWASLDYASGDQDPNDNKLQTYDPLYPLGQTFFGVHGLIDRRNLISASINADIVPAQKLLVRASMFSLWRAETTDAVYRTNGSILRPPSGSEARHIGVQAQGMVGYQAGRNLLLVGVLTWLRPGKFIKETQARPTSDFWLLSFALQWTF